jgi:hypothetical protein
MFNPNFLKAFRSVCVSVAVLLVAGAIFIYSLNNARASEFPDQFTSSQLDGKLMANSTTTIGKYMITYQLAVDPSDNKFYHFIAVWDSETGKSKIYVRDGENFKPSVAQLPAMPLQ